MTDTSSLSHLIERLEKATGSDRELDILIGYAVDLRGADKYLSFRTSFDTCGMEMMLRMAESHQNIWRTELPRYTASIDAAMTLVPEGMTCGFSGPIRRSSGVGHEGMFFGMCGSVPDDGFHIAVIAKTPATALCIAALKAQLSTRTNDQDDARNLSGVSSE